MFLTASVLFSQHNRLSEDSDFFIEFNYNKATGGEYYDSEGNQVHNHLDSTTYPGYTREYAFELSRHIFELKGGYEVLKNLDIIAGTQLHFYSLQENFTTDTVSRTAKRSDMYETRLDNIELGANYYLHKTNDFLRLRLSTRLPLSQSDTDVRLQKHNEFLSSSPYEFLAGLDGGYFFTKTYFGGEAYYNLRSGDFSDQLITGATFGLSTVENTMLSLNARYVMALEDNPYQDFNIRTLPTHETYFDIGFGFWIFFSEKYYFNFNYKLKPLGENTWNAGTINATAGFNY